jgi:2-polyprenyl-3-methyl-5-hydroxy-6-metoxy-1,4-benzoquinol methylase
VYHLGSAGDDGNGTMHKFLLKHLPNSKVIGVDMQKGKYTDVVFDLNKPFPKSWKADYVIAGAVIEHMDNPLDFLNKCYRMLNKGGRLILDTPNVGWYVFKRLVERGGDDATNGHLYVWDRASLARLFKKTKFRKVSIEHGLLYFNLTLKQVLSMFLFVEYAVCSVYSELCPSLYVVAEK